MSEKERAKKQKRPHEPSRLDTPVRYPLRAATIIIPPTLDTLPAGQEPLELALDEL